MERENRRSAVRSYVKYAREHVVWQIVKCAQRKMMSV